MIVVSQYEGQKVAVFGLGKAGEATIASLLAGGAHIYAWDDSDVSCERAMSTYSGRIHIQPIDRWPWDDIKALALSPGVPLTHPIPHDVVLLAQQYGCPVIGDIELMYMACPDARYIGITGTNGKSTVTSLTGHILKHGGIRTEVGGNLGDAVLSLAALGSEGTYVIETSSYQLDLLAATHFDIAVLLNLSPDHLDRHGSMEGYITAKKHIFDNQTRQDVAIVALDDEHTVSVAASLQAQKNQQVVDISSRMALATGVYVQEGMLVDGAYQFDLRSIATLQGQHNWQNAAAAYSVARICGMNPDVIYRAMQSFTGLAHRMQSVAKIQNVEFVNDSKATNAHAVASALGAYERVYWILGGEAKEGGITSLSEHFHRIEHAFLIGKAEEAFATVLEKHHVPFTRCGTLDIALKRASEKALAEQKEHAVVLLSPACASKDQWKSFEQRGQAFCDMVSALVRSESEGDNTHAI